MNIALILSGGTGARLGTEIPKQYLEEGGRPVLSYCLETLSLHAGIDAIQIVAEPSWRPQISRWLEKAAFHPAWPGGHSRIRDGYRLCTDSRCGAAVALG